MEAEAHPIVQNLNKKLREQEQTVFPTWLDPELLPDYDISHLTKKFKDPDVATWVYRLIREEFPGRLPPRGNSGGGLIAELEEAKKENFELESKVSALAWVLPVRAARYTGIPLPVYGYPNFGRSVLGCIEADVCN